jgi:hypothetical protein
MQRHGSMKDHIVWFFCLSKMPFSFIFSQCARTGAGSDSEPRRHGSTELNISSRWTTNLARGQGCSPTQASEKRASPDDVLLL